MRFFRYSPAVTKGLKKVTNLFQIGLFPHKKVKFAYFSTKQVCNVKKKNFQCLIQPFADHYEKIRNHLREMAINSAKIHTRY